MSELTEISIQVGLELERNMIFKCDLGEMKVKDLHSISLKERKNAKIIMRTLLN